MASVERFIPRYAAEPPQEALPYGRWAERLGREFLAGCLELEREQADGEELELGEPGELSWYPDRSWNGRTYVPGTTITTAGYELFGYVSFRPPIEGSEPTEFETYVDFTDQTAAEHPEWRLDLCDEVIGRWRGIGGASAEMTLVWGRPIVRGGVVASGELDGVEVDRCDLLEERFTLIAPDDYREELLEIKLLDSRGRELARESLYEGEEPPET